jgi:hypothetical protein
MANGDPSRRHGSRSSMCWSSLLAPRPLRQDARIWHKDFAGRARRRTTFDDPSDFQGVFASLTRYFWLISASHAIPARVGSKSPCPPPRPGGLKHTDLEIFLKVFAGRRGVTRQGLGVDPERRGRPLHRPNNFPPAEANRIRVALHRARKKLGRLTGFFERCNVPCPRRI